MNHIPGHPLSRDAPLSDDPDTAHHSRGGCTTLLPSTQKSAILLLVSNSYRKSRCWRMLLRAAILLVVSLPLLSCKKTPGSGAAAPSVSNSSMTRTGWTVYLVPTDAGVDAQAAEQTARDLLPQMAKDPETSALLRKLYGDQPVQFKVLDQGKPAGANQLEAPLDSGFAVALRARFVATNRQTDGRSNFQSLGIVLDLGQSSRIQVANASTATQMTDISRKIDSALRDQPDPLEIMTLAINDYLLRRDLPWEVAQDMPKPADTRPATAPAQRRSELDRRIAERAERSTRYYQEMAR